MLELELTRGAGSTEGAFAPTASLGKAGSSWPPQFPKGTYYPWPLWAHSEICFKRSKWIGKQSTCQNLRIFAQNEGFAQNIQIFENIKKNAFRDPLEFTTPIGNAPKRDQKLEPKYNSAQIMKKGQKVWLWWVFLTAFWALTSRKDFENGSKRGK